MVRQSISNTVFKQLENKTEYFIFLYKFNNGQVLKISYDLTTAAFEMPWEHQTSKGKGIFEGTKQFRGENKASRRKRYPPQSKIFLG